MKKILLLLLLILPFILLAQNESLEIFESLNQNVSLIEQFAHLAPMGVNPYLTVFLTSFCSKIGFHNEYVATNPFFNSWFILILFGVLFLFTALVGTVFKTNKATAPIGLADTYLSNNAALLINGIIMLAPAILSNDPSHNETVYQASFLSISFKMILVLTISMYFLIVVMTVRFFIDILIFLSPIPFIDSILEIFKIIIGTFFVLISIISPIASIILSGIMFLIAIFFYKRSVRLVNKTKYLIVYPLLNLFRGKQKILTNGKSLSILVLTNKKIGKLKKGIIVRLEERNNKYWLIKRQFLLSNIEEEVSFDSCYFSQNHLDVLLKNENATISLVLNRSYHKHIDELADKFDIKIRKRTETNINMGILNRIKSMFSKSDIAELRSVAK